jgi:hypothetical protein
MYALAAKRARLAEVERELARLRYRHDIAMSAFRFEEATALGPAIVALDKERQALAAILPATAEPATGVVPQLMRPRRRTRKHCSGAKPVG